MEAIEDTVPPVAAGKKVQLPPLVRITAPKDVVCERARRAPVVRALYVSGAAAAAARSSSAQVTPKTATQVDAAARRARKGRATQRAAQQQRRTAPREARSAPGHPRSYAGTRRCGAGKTN